MALHLHSDLKLLLLTPLSPRLILGEKVSVSVESVALPLLAVGLVVLVSVWGRALGLGLGYDLVAVTGAGPPAPRTLALALL